MKNLKLLLLSFALIAFSFTACTNDEPIDNDQQQTEESASITTAMEELSSRFSDDGNIIVNQNPSGNIIFDFCFDFVYPLTLSYSNDTTVTVNSFEDLIEVIINSTEELYVDGIAFPFDVETYDDDSDSIVIETINNEDEFVDLLESCDFDDDDFDCECTEEFDPVCVEINDPNGESFLITYPNACFAECDGFTEEDFAENCEDDYNCPGGTECFDFVFPLTIITDDGETVTVGSQEELDTALYDANYFDFVYPFEVTLNDDDDDDDETITINNEEEFFELLEDCYDDEDDDDDDEDDDDEDDDDDDEDDDCECNEEFDPVCVEVETATGETIVVTFPNECYAECEGFDSEDFIECEENNECDCTDDEDPVCVEYTEPSTGEIITITFLNECYALCEGFTPNDFVDCD